MFRFQKAQKEDFDRVQTFYWDVIEDILNSEHNDGYDGCPWSIDCDQKDVITPHALAVSPKFQ